MSDALLADHEAQFQDAVRAFTAREITPHAAAWDRAGRYPRELFARLGALGWLGTAFPEDVGGSGGGSTLYALMCAELARGSAGVALGMYVHTALACGAVHHLGSDGQRRRILPAALRGERIACWAYAEPGAGSDVASVRTRARREGGGYVLDGGKLYITNAPFADFAVLVASTEPERGLKGLSLFVVELDRPGVTVGRPMEKLGMGASEMAEIVLDGCRAGEADRLGPEGTGFLQAMKVLTLGRIAAAAFGVGLGRAAHETALTHVRERVQFGGPLLRQQFVRFTLADMATRLEAAWQLTLHAARLADAGKPHGNEASMAKLFATETCTWTCERALHLCGAQGYMLESAAQRFYRDCKVLEYGEGTSEIQRETIARALEA
ncbi:MAG: acyl-CoA dehydrogenase family protein [Deltaproteobacteria bacterium]|nr:acyl-CoA dehydrogenase family protein [Deltaproteobacteria bacterium]